MQPLQQQQQLEPQPGPSATPAALRSGAGTSSSLKQPAPLAPASSAQQQPPPQHSQQQCLVVGQLLQLSKQRDAQMRCLVARCLSNFHPAKQAEQSPGAASEVCMCGDVTNDVV